VALARDTLCGLESLLEGEREVRCAIGGRILLMRYTESSDESLYSYVELWFRMLTRLAIGGFLGERLSSEFVAELACHSRIIV
jgi:hypothetical protein